MIRGSAGWLPLLLTPLWAGAGACHQHQENGGDGAGDAAPYDAPVAGDGIAPLALDFTATGCDSFDLAASRCAGAAPLTVTFSPIGSPSLTQFLWDFGDGTPMSKEVSPRHSYTLPGAFTVTLVGDGASGSLSRTHAQFISVAVAAVGQLCDVDAQCAPGLRCLCGSAIDCGSAFVRGLCTADCTDGNCAAGAACADLPASPSQPPTPIAAFQRPLCVAACADDSACVEGLRCRQLPTNGNDPLLTWARGCFPPALADVGASCRGPDGALSGAACTSGQCADFGALGLCSATCSESAGCPDLTACAHFGDDRWLCLRTCSTATDCAGDPLLTCAAQTATPAAGTLGFTLVGPGGDGGQACGPRPCLTPADCQPAGVCREGYCRAP